MSENRVWIKTVLCLFNDFTKFNIIKGVVHIQCVDGIILVLFYLTDSCPGCLIKA